jgi:hypothetical protein
MVAAVAAAAASPLPACRRRRVAAPPGALRRVAKARAACRRQAGRMRRDRSARGFLSVTAVLVHALPLSVSGARQRSRAVAPCNRCRSSRGLGRKLLLPALRRIQIQGSLRHSHVHLMLLIEMSVRAEQSGVQATSVLDRRTRRMTSWSAAFCASEQGGIALPLVLAVLAAAMRLMFTAALPRRSALLLRSLAQAVVLTLSGCESCKSSAILRESPAGAEGCPLPAPPDAGRGSDGDCAIR